MLNKIELSVKIMDKFEYLLKGWLEEFDAPFIDWINNLGADGWELVISFNDPSDKKSSHCIFKRKMSELKLENGKLSNISKSVCPKCGCGGNLKLTEDGLVCDVCG